MNEFANDRTWHPASPVTFAVIRFGIVGLIGTCAHVFGVVAAVEWMGLDPRPANLLGYCLALPLVYWGHYHFSFASDHEHKRTVWRFLLVSLTCYLFGQFLMNVLFGIFDWSYMVALGVIVVAMPVLSFALNKFLVFQRDRPLWEVADR